MKYKLVCIDMDGTLLDDEKKISTENLEAIRKAHEIGVKIVVCTGRLFTSAKYFSDLLQVKTPVICSNGAYIREKDKDEVIYKSAIGIESCKKILSVVNNYDFNIFFNTHESVISVKPFPLDNTYLKMNNNIPKEAQIKLLYDIDINKNLELYSGDIVKCICIGDNIEKLQEARKKLEKFNMFEIVSSDAYNFEIMCKDISKGKAVEVLVGIYGYTKDEVICIGDNENDISMLKYAGKGIAMGNADEFVKSFADYVTDTNNNSGVSRAIHKFIL